ncbi:MAG TPA: MarR family transcriptional regulator [Syntrophorhabdaceae bacterium]|jgi:DNA-binding MarR family transcriptional regulator
MTELYPIEELLVHWVYRVQTEGVALLTKRFRSAGHTTTPEQFGVLARLRGEQGLNQTELGKRMLKDRHNMTRILNLLEKQGHIERRLDSSDRRIFRIFLTESGKKAHEELTPIVRTHLDELLDGLAGRDQETICRSLKHIVSNIQNCGSQSG